MDKFSWDPGVHNVPIDIYLFCGRYNTKTIKKSYVFKLWGLMGHNKKATWFITQIC